MGGGIRRPVLELYLRAAPQSFAANDAERLVAALSRVDQHTRVAPVGTPDELRLDRRGLTVRGGCRFTYPAFARLCLILAPGLLRLVQDLCGAVRGQAQEKHIDGRLAIGVFNQLVELRYDRVATLRLVRNEADKLIEGVVGARHQFWANSELFSRAQEALAGETSGIKFHGAMLIGRQLLLWYRRASPFFVGDVAGTRWAWHSGYYLRNTEANGVSVAANAAVFSRAGVCWAGGREFGGRVAHSGNAFDKRLQRLFGGLLSKQLPEPKIIDGFRRAATTSLGFPETGEEAMAAKAKALTAQLVAAGLSQRLAVAVLSRTLSHGASQALQSDYAIGRRCAGRTVLDLFSAIVWVSRGLGLPRRDVVEQLGYKVLAGGMA